MATCFGVVSMVILIGMVSLCFKYHGLDSKRPQAKNQSMPEPVFYDAQTSPLVGKQWQLSSDRFVYECLSWFNVRQHNEATSANKYQNIAFDVQLVGVIKVVFLYLSGHLHKDVFCTFLSEILSDSFHTFSILVQDEYLAEQCSLLCCH